MINHTITKSSGLERNLERLVESLVGWADLYAAQWYAGIDCKIFLSQAG